VDDDEKQLMFTKLILEESNPSITVTSISSPEEAVRELEKDRYDCVISDYNMPRLDGLQLAKKIREISDIPILLYTGQGSEEIAEQAFSSGVDCYVRKEANQANYHILTQSIQNLVEKHRAQTQLTESEQRYKRLVEESPLPISVTTGDLIVYVNQKGQN